MWRENGSQVFLDEEQLRTTALSYGMKLTSRLGKVAALPIGIQETYEFISAMLPQTQVALDEGARGRGEGIAAFDEMPSRFRANFTSGGSI